MELEHPTLEPFEPTLRHLIEIAFAPPWLFPRSALLMLRWAPADPRRRSITETFAAYGELQRAVASQVIALEKATRAAAKELKAVRTTRDTASEAVLTQKINVLRRRQLVLRRTVDAVIHVVCDQYVWFIRRLALHDHIRPVDLENLAHIVEEADQLNKRDPLTLYLASDLTTAVQIGDLVEVSTDARLRFRVRLLEVKEGAVNEILLERLAGGPAEEGALLSIRDAMGEKKAQQAARILRQGRRMKGLQDFARTYRSIDPRTGAHIQRTPDAPPSPGYQPALRKLIEKAATGGQPHTRLDGCLTLASIRADMLPEPHLGQAAHALFHFDHPEMPCLLTTEREREELEALTKEPPVIDFVEHAFRVAWASPIFSWGTLDRVCDVLTGRIKTYAKFDGVALMQRAAALGIKMKWATGQRAERLKQTSGTTWIPGSPKASAILVELPDGTRFELLSGWLSRIFFELAKPATLLNYLLALGPYVRAIQDEVERAIKKDQPD